MTTDNPILNNPCEEPKQHYATDADGNLSYEQVCMGRLIFIPDVQARDKAMKKDYVNTRWLPAVNSVREKYGYGQWRFIEIAGDIRDIKNQLIAAIEGAVTA